MKLDLFGPHFKADPYPTYAQLRDYEPICRRDAAGGKSIWFVTRYDDVSALLREPVHFVKDVRNTMTPAERAQLPPTPDLVGLLGNHMLNLDPPDHTRLRTLVNKAFTGAVVQRMAPRIQAIADGLLDRVQRRGRMNLIEEFAFPLPITVIAELLGVPARDRARFRHWSDAFVTPSVNVQRGAKKVLKMRRRMEDFTGYMRAIFNERRQTPRDDLITLLLQAEEAGDRLREDELFSMVILLMVAGHETVVNLIGNGVLALLHHPAQMALLRARPDLIESAVEEMVRFDGPVERATMRFAADDLMVGSHLFHRGDAVSLVLAAADRDPAHFTEPDQFDITRQPNRHLGFGQGIHYCLGGGAGPPRSQDCAGRVAPAAARAAAGDSRTAALAGRAHPAWAATAPRGVGNEPYNVVLFAMQCGWTITPFFAIMNRLELVFGTFIAVWRKRCEGIQCHHFKLSASFSPRVTSHRPSSNWPMGCAGACATRSCWASPGRARPTPWPS